MTRAQVGHGLLFLVLAACGAEQNSSSFSLPNRGQRDTGSSTNPTRGNSASDIIDTSVGGSTSSTNGCSDAAKLVYVLSDKNVLYSFYPSEKRFEAVGALDCPLPDSMEPNSMAIDRNAVAWVNYVDSSLFGGDGESVLAAVSTKTGKCTGQIIKLSSPWNRLGMGFSTDAASSKRETLFVTALGVGNGNMGFGRVDFDAKTIVPIGAGANLAGVGAELTGTGDGRLYGFAPATPVVVAELDKSGAAKSQTPLPNVEVPAAWAFSFWGGRFYLYTAPVDLFGGRTSNVAEFDPKTGKADAKFMENVGFRIVGAGVSTCAPVEPPR